MRSVLKAVKEEQRDAGIVEGVKATLVSEFVIIALIAIGYFGTLFVCSLFADGPSRLMLIEEFRKSHRTYSENVRPYLQVPDVSEQAKKPIEI
jgi:hypothetical protein